MTTLEKLEELIYHGFKETDRKIEETDRILRERSQETDRKIEETDRILRERSQETDRKIEETDRILRERSKETDRKIEESDRIARERSQETDRKIEETDRILRERSQEVDRMFEESDRIARERSQESARDFEETRRMLREHIEQWQKESKETNRRFRVTDRKLRKLIGDSDGLKKSVGLFAESAVKPAMIRIFGKRDIELNGTSVRSKKYYNGGTMEVDVIGTGPSHVVAVEVKFRLEYQDVVEFLEHLPHFFDFFPEYRGLALHAAVAGLSIDQDVDRFAYHQGLFVLAQSGETVRLLNDEKFVPRKF